MSSLPSFSIQVGTLDEWSVGMFTRDGTTITIERKGKEKKIRVAYALSGKFPSFSMIRFKSFTECFLYSFWILYSSRRQISLGFDEDARFEAGIFQVNRLLLCFARKGNRKSIAAGGRELELGSLGRQPTWASRSDNVP